MAVHGVKEPVRCYLIQLQKSLDKVQAIFSKNLLVLSDVLLNPLPIKVVGVEAHSALEGIMEVRERENGLCGGLVRQMIQLSLRKMSLRSFSTIVSNFNFNFSPFNINSSVCVCKLIKIEYEYMPLVPFHSWWGQCQDI